MAGDCSRGTYLNLIDFGHISSHEWVKCLDSLEAFNVNVIYQ